MHIKVKEQSGGCLQVAVALMRKMDLRAGESPEEGAARFARQLFDAWGVGDAGCNNGVLLLLALQDRQVLQAPLPVMESKLARTQELCSSTIAFCPV